MPKIPTSNFFPNGPFNESREKAAEFGANLYYQYYIQEASREIIKLQENYEAALSSDDPDKIKEAEVSLEAYNGVLLLTSTMLSESELQ